MLRAIIQSLTTFTGFSILALTFFSSNNLFGIIIGFVILLLGALVSRYVFKVVRSRPIAELSRFSTPDLDNLVPIPGSGIKEITPKLLTQAFNSNQWHLKGGKLKIWGDWKLKGLDEERDIQNLNYDYSRKLLSLTFNNGKVDILEPKIIHLSSAYLKIIQATSVKWSWGNQQTLIYKKIEDKVIRESNTALEISELDVDPSQSAFYYSTFD